MKMLRPLCILLIAGLSWGGCAEKDSQQNGVGEKGKIQKEETRENVEAPMEGPYLMVLGVAQDAGYPQAGCEKACCAPAWVDPSLRHSPACIALIDPSQGKKWLFEATPELPSQLNRLNDQLDSGDGQHPDGIFLTHAHIGHYTGLMYFGREVQGAKELPVHAMPKMAAFLKENAPWSQLVDLGNIAVQPLAADSAVPLGPSLSVTPFLVPHRDEFSETVGYRISSSSKSALFIPDINKWQVWERDLASELAQVDLAFLDATFFRAGELPGRDMSEIPHPFVQETMELLQDLPANEKQKVKFIHFNHTNPLNWDAEAAKEVQDAGFGIAEEGMAYPLY